MYKPITQAEFKSAAQIVAGDTYNIIQVRLLDHRGSEIDLTGAAVTWSAVQNGREIVKGRIAPAIGFTTVGVRFQANDPVKPGVVYLEFRVVKDGTVAIYPSTADLLLKVI